MTKAIITGICGQDGAYLAKLLLDKGHKVIGLARRNSSRKNLEYLGIDKDIDVTDCDITDYYHVSGIISQQKPDVVYNLAAQSHVGISFSNPMVTCQVNYGGFLNILMSCRRFAPECKIYQAGTSEMFGYAADTVANEQTPFAPMSPYAISKVAAHWAGVNARYEANQFVSNGILFNHESPLRGDDFVTKKICNYIKKGDFSIPLQLGNINSVRDWGHARDYVEAMYMMMELDIASDFVIATGQNLSVRDFLSRAFSHAGHELRFEGDYLLEKGFVGDKCVFKISEKYYRPNDLKYLKGNASRAKKILGWEPKTTIDELIKEMI
jgi:GDPmannose 4,6-dehydratase